MSNDTDASQLADHYELMINTHMTIDTCKECYASEIKEGKLYCLAANATLINCNLLQIHGDF